MGKIIDPSTLTDEQRKCIRENYNFQSRNHFMAKDADYNIMRYASEMAMVTMEWLFGKEFFEEKGE